MLLNGNQYGMIVFILMLIITNVGTIKYVNDLYTNSYIYVWNAITKRSILLEKIDRFFACGTVPTILSILHLIVIHSPLRFCQSITRHELNKNKVTAVETELKMENPSS